jgi:pimeloyl-ACP methyl ester carboxylesterase
MTATCWHLIIHTFLLLGGSLFANAADGLLLDVIVPPGEKDRFQHAEFSCWLPDAAKPVKAVIIHQHGCTNASPEKHPPITGDWHWRALARKHDAALLVPMYQVAKNCDEWNDPDSGSERALFTALADFSQRSGRAELKDAPWVLWGHSGGSSWSAQMIARHPGRVLAASFRGGCHKQFGVPEFREKFRAVAKDLPLLFVWGSRESVPASSHFVSWEPMNTMFRELRSDGGKVCRVIDPRSEHGCDDSRLMSISFFDAVLSGETKPGTLADINTLDLRELNSSTRNDPALAWMPNAGFAKLWREFSEHGALRPAGPKLTAPELSVVRDAQGRAQLSWRVIPEISGGLRALRIYRDGKLWKELGLKPGDFLATGRDSAPEALRGGGATDESTEPHTYTLTFLDAAGNESPHGQP